MQRVRHANRGRLLLRTPGPVPHGTCMCSNVETDLSWTCLVSGFLSFEHPSVLLFCLFLVSVCVILKLELHVCSVRLSKRSWVVLVITYLLCIASFEWPFIANWLEGRTIKYTNFPAKYMNSRSKLHWNIHVVLCQVSVTWNKRRGIGIPELCDHAERHSAFNNSSKWISLIFHFYDIFLVFFPLMWCLQVYWH